MPVLVHVRVRDVDQLRVLQVTSRHSERLIPFRSSAPFGPPPRLVLYVGAGGDNWLDLGSGPFVFNAWDSSVGEQVLAHGGTVVFGVCLWWGALLARRLLLSIGGGQPFQRRNAARIAVIAALMVVATAAGGLLPYLAARLVLGRLRLGGAGSPLVAQLAIPVMPLLVAVVLLAVAFAFRRGTHLASDAEGLV